MVDDNDGEEEEAMMVVEEVEEEEDEDEGWTVDQSTLERNRNPFSAAGLSKPLARIGISLQVTRAYQNEIQAEA
jgi:hypothetical protein